MECITLFISLSSEVSFFAMLKMLNFSLGLFELISFTFFFDFGFLLETVNEVFLTVGDHRTVIKLFFF